MRFGTGGLAGFGLGDGLSLAWFDRVVLLACSLLLCVDSNACEDELGLGLFVMRPALALP